MSAHPHAPEPERDPRPARLRRRRRALTAGAPVAVLIGAALLAYALIETRPVAERRPRAREARLVEVSPVRAGAERVRVTAMGTVAPAREIELRPQVSGRLVEVSPELVPGGRFAAGDRMAVVDPLEYELVVEQRRSALEQAQVAERLEEANQSIARLEYQLLEETIREGDEELVLRRPQLDAVRAQVKSARAALREAELQLERTRILAPFDAIVRSRGADLGARVDPGSVLASLVGTERYWVELSVPVSQLRWIEIPRSAEGHGSRVRLYDESAWGPGRSREGRVARLRGALESEGRMARVLVEVEDPLALGEAHAGVPPLLIGSYLRAEIDGATLEDVVAVDRRALREGDRVWLFADDGSLEIRPVEVAYRADDHVLITAGLAEGERLVVSDLAAPVPGMPLRTRAGEDRPVEPGEASSPGGEQP